MGRESVFGGYSDRVGIRQNLDGSVSQRAFAPEGRGSTSTLRYIDAAGRRDEGKVVFYLLLSGKSLDAANLSF